MNDKQRQQGDVCYEKVSVLPEGAMKVARTHEKGHILAVGEATGHHHAIADDCEVYEKDGILYLVNEKAVVLNHEEHKPQVIEPGIWKIGIVNEHDYTRDMVRNVQD